VPFCLIGNPLQQPRFFFSMFARSLSALSSFRISPDLATRARRTRSVAGCHGRGTSLALTSRLPPWMPSGNDYSRRRRRSPYPRSFRAHDRSHQASIERSRPARHLGVAERSLDLNPHLGRLGLLDGAVHRQHRSNAARRSLGRCRSHRAPVRGKIGTRRNIVDVAEHRLAGKMPGQSVEDCGR